MLLDTEDPLARDVTAAIHAGELPRLRSLLAAHPGLSSAQLGDPDCSRSLLHVATDWPGHYPSVADTIRSLVEAGADPNARFVGDAHNETPLHWAASSDDVPALDALLDAGADIDAPGGVVDGGAPLADARIFAQWDAGRRLVERGAATTLQDEATLGLMDRLQLRLKRDEPTADEISKAFWGACHGGSLAAAELFLERGADLDWVPPWEPLTPLDAAVRSNEENNTQADDLVAWLRQRGARTATDLS